MIRIRVPRFSLLRSLSAAALVLGLAAFAPVSPTAATTMRAVYSGTILTAAGDDLRFGAPAAELIGLPFTAVFTYAPATMSRPLYFERDVLLSIATGSVPAGRHTATLTINGQSMRSVGNRFFIVGNFRLDSFDHMVEHRVSDRTEAGGKRVIGALRAEFVESVRFNPSGATIPIDVLASFSLSGPFGGSMSFEYGSTDLCNGCAHRHSRPRRGRLGLGRGRAAPGRRAHARRRARCACPRPPARPGGWHRGRAEGRRARCARAGHRRLTPPPARGPSPGHTTLPSTRRVSVMTMLRVPRLRHLLAAGLALALGASAAAAAPLRAVYEGFVIAAEGNDTMFGAPPATLAGRPFRAVVDYDPASLQRQTTATDDLLLSGPLYGLPVGAHRARLTINGGTGRIRGTFGCCAGMGIFGSGVSATHFIEDRIDTGTLQVLRFLAIGFLDAGGGTIPLDVLARYTASGDQTSSTSTFRFMRANVAAGTPSTHITGALQVESVSVAAVPLPAGAPLLVAALAGLALLRRRNGTGAAAG